MGCSCSCNRKFYFCLFWIYIFSNGRCLASSRRGSEANPVAGIAGTGFLGWRRRLRPLFDQVERPVAVAAAVGMWGTPERVRLRHPEAEARHHAETRHLPKPVSPPWRRASRKPASGKPGAVHPVGEAWDFIASARSRWWRARRLIPRRPRRRGGGGEASVTYQIIVLKACRRTSHRWSNFRCPFYQFASYPRVSTWMKFE